MLRILLLACAIVPCMAGGKPTELFFMALTLIIGVIVRQLSKHTRVPFTVVMFVVGFVLCQFGLWIPSLYDGMGLNLSHMNPHTLLYSFLPILIFESAFAMHVHTFLGLIKPCIILAGPGLLFCGFLSGAFIKGMHDDWSLIKSLLLGITLSATDPVAVVALLKELGASEQVSTLIEGESLLNDGSAIVVFNILYAALESNDIGSVGGIIGTFIRLAVGGPVFGFICGLIAVKLLSRTFNDAIVEISITLVGAYLVFYIGEGLLGVSGVLALVAMGVTMASNKNAISPEVEHAMHDFWGILVWYANTLIFTLVGVQCRNAFAAQHIFGMDWLRLLALYLFLNVTRFAMLALLRPLINSGHGYQLDWKNAVLCGWGGLRGGVGLALALIISNTPVLVAKDPRMAEVAEFYTSGIVILTILVNGVSTQNLVAYLQLATTAPVKNKALFFSYRKLQRAADSSIRTGKLTAAIANADWKLVSSFTQTWLDEQLQSLPPAGCSFQDYLHHLVLGLFHAAVWRQYKEGLALKRTTRTLLAMIEDAEEHGHDVGGARLIQHYVNRKPVLASLPFFSGLDRQPPALAEVDLCLCYIAAMEEVADELDHSNAVAEPALLLHEQEAIRRGLAAVRQHLLHLEQSAPQITQRLKTAYASRRVLNSCRLALTEAVEQGTVDEGTAERIQPGLEHAMRRVRAELVKKEARVQQPNDVLLALQWVQLLAPQAQQRLLALVASNARAAPPSAVLTELHQKPGGVGLILAGTVSLAARSGKPLFLGVGTMFNCYCFLTGKPAIQRVVAESEVRYAWFPDDLLNDLLPAQLPAPKTIGGWGNNSGSVTHTGGANPAREALWHEVGVRVAVAMLETNLSFVALGRERLLDLCTHGRVFRLIPEKAMPLWPAYHYLLLRGTARRLTDHVAFSAPATLMPSSTATVDPATAVKSLTPDQLGQLQSAFKLFDRDGSGALDEVEFLSAMRFMGCDVGLPEARQLLSEADADGSDGLDLDEFVAITLRNMVVFSADAKVFAVPKWLGGGETEQESPRAVPFSPSPSHQHSHSPVTSLPTLVRDPSEGHLPTSTLLQPQAQHTSYPQYKPYSMHGAL